MTKQSLHTSNMGSVIKEQNDNIFDIQLSVQQPVCISVFKDNSSYFQPRLGFFLIRAAIAIDSVKIFSGWLSSLIQLCRASSAVGPEKGLKHVLPTK